MLLGQITTEKARYQLQVQTQNKALKFLNGVLGTLQYKTHLKDSQIIREIASQFWFLS